MQSLRSVRRSGGCPRGLTLAGVLFFGLTSIAAASSSSRNDCELVNAELPVSTTVDYSTSRAVEQADTTLRDEVKQLDSLVLGKQLDHSVPRKAMQTVDDGIDTDTANAAELLAEKRLLERQNDTEHSNDVKTRLPGVDTNNVRAFRKQMYRTDI